MTAPEFGQAGAVPSRSSRRKYTFFGLLIVLPLCLGIGAYFYLSILGQSRFQEAVDEAARDDPYWRFPDLELHRKEVADAQNSMPHILAARQLLKGQWPTWPVPDADKDPNYTRQLREAYDVSFGELDPPVQLNELQIAALRGELKRAEAALARARKLVDLPNGRAPITYTKDFIGTLLPHAQQAREVENLLSYDALLRAQDQDMEGALASCRAGINNSRALGDEPFLISQLVRIACRTVAMRRLERCLAQGQPSEASLAAVQRMLAEDAEEPLLLYGLRGERAGLDLLFDAIESGDIKLGQLRGLMAPVKANLFTDELPLYLLVLGNAKTQRAAMIRYMTNAINISKLPAPEQISKLKEIEATIKDQPLLLRLLLPAVLKVAEASNRSRAEARCAAVALAVERYRRAEGRWPDSLNQLLPRFLKEIPTDPFDGKPLRFVRFDQGVTVYSVGQDGVDNGGNISKNSVSLGADLGFRLWDVAKRRQPAKPFPMPARAASVSETMPEPVGGAGLEPPASEPVKQAPK